VERTDKPLDGGDKMEDLAPKWWLCWLTFMLRRYCKCFTSIEILDREWMNPIWLWKKGIPKSSDLPSCSLFCGIPHFQRNREWWLVNILNKYIYIIVNHHKWKIKILQTLHPFSLNKGLSHLTGGLVRFNQFCSVIEACPLASHGHLFPIGDVWYTLVKG
jgi:hypothetical protein